MVQNKIISRHALDRLVAHQCAAAHRLRSTGLEYHGIWKSTKNRYFLTCTVPPKIQFENLGPVNESERVDWECKTLKGIPKVDIGIYRNNIRLTTSNMVGGTRTP